MPAVAVLTLVGTVSSCRDKDFDWDDAHANTAQKKFTETFIKEFGKPAEGHQWGFDYANYAMGGANISETRAVAKGDMNVNLQDGTNVPVFVFYSAPEQISQDEHEAVFAWFSNHKVSWTYPESNWEKGSTTNTRQSSGIAIDISGTEESKHSYPTNCSLFEDKYNNPMGDYTMTEDVTFTNGWLQHVAKDEDCVQRTTPGSSEQGTVTDPARNMDQLCTQLLSANGTSTWGNHVLDYNGGTGYGYGTTDPRQTGILITDANMNNWTYRNTTVDCVNDKFLLVYLQGHDADGREWSGWYLGFDFGGHKSNGAASYAADGICNDWILKLSDAGNNVFTRSRIMCEDLGGSMATASDIDYNDVVLDVDYDGTGNVSGGQANVKLTLRAAGGTMPLAVFYDDVPLFEVHEFLKQGKIWEDGHVQNNPGFYKIMYNTGLEDSNGGEAAPRSYALGFKMDANTQGGSIPGKRIDQGFELQKIQIKVFRPFEQGNVEDYINSSDIGQVPTSEAYWVSLKNIDGEAPLKICVPQTYQGSPVKWLKERVKITDGYSGFRDWVANSAKIFWANPATDNSHAIFYYNANNQ